MVRWHSKYGRTDRLQYKFTKTVQNSCLLQTCLGASACGRRPVDRNVVATSFSSDLSDAKGFLR